MNEVNFSKIKCVITDFDCTLYSNAAFDKTEQYYLEYFKLKGYLPQNRKSLGKILAKKPVYHNLQCVVEYLKKKGYSVQDFFDYMGEHPYNFLTNDIQSVNPKIIESLSKLYPLYLLSDSAPGYIDHYLKIFEIEKTNFVKCVSNDYKTDDLTKVPLMKEILETSGLKSEEVLMVGDSLRCDIETAKSLNMQTFWVKNVEDTEYIFNELINFKNNKI